MFIILCPEEIQRPFVVKYSTSALVNRSSITDILMCRIGGVSSSSKTQFTELRNRLQVKFEEMKAKEMCRPHWDLRG